jgi:hypothetical protein
VERDDAGRVLDERDAVDRDDERDEAEPREGVRDEDEVEREDEDREPDERSVVECERVPRRVDSCELTAHPPLFPSSDQICPMVIHSLQQHLHRPCRLWRQLQPQFQPECSQS